MTSASYNSEQQLAFLVRARIAELLDDLCRAVVQSIEVVSLLLRHAPPRETVDATDSSVQIPATKISDLVSFSWAMLATLMESPINMLSSVRYTTDRTGNDHKLDECRRILDRKINRGGWRIFDI
jgi:hypothetical protein